MNGRYKLGCDIGGTFTDFVLVDQDTGAMTLAKCLTTPDDPSRGVLAGIDQLNLRVPGFLAGTEQVLHGTTLVINAVMQRSGAKTGLVTTEGFRDVLEIGTEKRYDAYDLQQEYPLPLVPRHLRFGVRERLRSDGKVLLPFEPASLEPALDAFAAEGVASVAVCLLHAYRTADHERQVRDILRRRLPGVSVSISSEVLPEINEYARTSTTVVNAYAKPLMRDYLGRLDEVLKTRGFSGRLLVMLSSGGVTSISTAIDYPVRVIESGPVGGVILGQHLRRELDLGPVLAFDMGGTTAKVCHMDSDEIRRASIYEVARVHRFKEGSGIPIKVPCIDILEIGTGGGSIAHVGPLGLLEIGPESAGAAPGPACYGQGGMRPTVTDADLVLGYLGANSFLGGKMALDTAAARTAIRDGVGAPLGRGDLAAAWSIHDLANESMASAARVYAAERGVLASEMRLIASGGAGPVHAFGLARKLGMAEIVIPRAVGVASAAGFMVAPVAFDLVQTYKVRLGTADLTAIDAIFERLALQADATLAEAGSVTRRRERSLDVRYAGQGYDLNIRLPDTPLESLGHNGLQRRFAETYTAIYGQALSGHDFEIVNIRLIASGPEPTSPFAAFAPPEVPRAPKGERQAYCPVAGAMVAHAVWDRAALAPGLEVRGPALIEETESTTVVGTGASIACDPTGCLRIRLDRQDKGAR
ncbi:MAG: hydantoinase/oxoprolinase family protein [Rhodobacteraceae bacterium]|jgi:N-methylhydantoinase A|nr:hydantoinase/oxoprolinase family protein [Paracoccaceae bacterium]